MHTGKVLLVAGSGNDRATFDAGTFRTSVWDPVTDTFTSVSTPWDAFCAGHAQLPDGRLLVAGGTGAYESSGGPTAFAGTNKAYVFDPDTDTYQAAPNMDNARWYPSLLTLGDGSVLAVAGQGSDGKLTYNSQKYFGGAWTPNRPPPTYDDASSTKQLWPLYPGLHLMADGRVFFSGAHTFGGTPSPGIWNLTANTFHPVGGLPDLHHTDHAMSVLLPPAQDQKVMIIGGGSDDGSLSTDSTSIVDLDDPSPQYTPAAKLDTPKMYVSAVILPDRTVFETGARCATATSPTATSSPRRSSILAPGSGRRRRTRRCRAATTPLRSCSPTDASATFGNNPSSGTFEMRIEIYSPDYLTKGTRPQITSVPTEMTYGGSYAMTTTQAAPITSVSLVRPMAVTHSSDGNQRLVDVPFVANPDGSLQLSVTSNPNIAPPGWYMLFAVDATGVPSVASWVHVE